MTQPLDRSASIPQVGELDTETGEFWREHTFEMGRGEDNLSAYEPNRMFLNQGGKEFLDCSFGSGCDIDADSRSVVAADFDRDGRVDLLVGSVGGGPLRLFANRFPDKSRSIRLVLRGVESNKQGVGSRVTATINGKKVIRDMFPVNGCLGQAPSELLLGMGNAETIQQLQIRWPTGKSQTIRDVPADGVVTVTEGENAFRFTSYSNAVRASKGEVNRFIAIDTPKIKTAREANLPATERVLGVTQQGSARAYPTRYLQAHHLCNDEINGTPILVSYCAPALASTAFERQLQNGNDKLTLQFRVLGMIEGTGYTVLQDDQTKSFWNPLTGQCIRGRLRGTTLKRVSVLSTTWKSWVKLTPSTTVLGRERTNYASLDESKSGAQYVTKQVRDSCDPDTVGLGIGGTAQKLFFPLDVLASFKGSFIAGKLDERPVVVFYDATNSAAQCYYSSGGSIGGSLKFSKSKSRPGQFVTEDGSVFDMLGRCVAGRLAGQRLTPVANATVTRWYAWNVTFPQSVVVKSK